MNKLITKNLIKFSILTLFLGLGLFIIKTPFSQALTIAGQNGVPSACPDKYPYNTGTCTVFINSITVNGFRDDDTSYTARITPVPYGYLIPGQTITISWTDNTDGWYDPNLKDISYYLIKYGCGNSIDLANDSNTIIRITGKKSFSWVVPSDISNYQYCKIWVYAKNVDQNSHPTLGVSNTRAFTIQPSKCSINSFTSDKTNINSGESAALTWNTTNCTFCTASSNPNNSYWYGAKSTLGSNTIYNLVNTTTFTLSCTNNSNSDTKTVTINVNTPPPPKQCVINSFTSDKTTINSGESTTLTWNTSNCTSCTASSNPATYYWNGYANTYGSATIYNLTNTTTFTLTCSNSNNTDFKNVTISVNPPPVRYSCNTTTYQCYQTTNGTYSSYNDCVNACQPPLTRYTCNANYQCVVASNGEYNSLVSCQNACVPPTRCVINNFTSSNYNVNPNDNFILTWNTSNCTSCTASSNPATYYWNGYANTYGSATIYNLTNTTTFTLTCNGYNSSDSKSLTVTAQSIQPSLSLWADAYTIKKGDSTYVRWVSYNSSYCVASNGWSGTKSVSGYELVNPNQATTYTLTCYSSNNISTSQSVTIYVTEPTTALSFIKLGRNITQGDYNYNEVIKAQEGDTLEFYLAVIAGNNQDLNNVIVTDNLPSVFTYISGSTKVNGVSINDDSITTGLNLGTITRGNYKIVTFKVKANNPGTNFTYTNTAKVVANNSQTVSDTATITYGLVAGAATVETGAEDTILIAFILSFIFTLILWYYLKFTEKGKLVLARTENKIREMRLEALRKRMK